MVDGVRARHKVKEVPSRDKLVKQSVIRKDIPTPGPSRMRRGGQSGWLCQQETWCNGAR